MLSSRCTYIFSLLISIFVATSAMWCIMLFHFHQKTWEEALLVPLGQPVHWASASCSILPCNFQTWPDKVGKVQCANSLACKIHTDINDQLWLLNHKGGRRALQWLWHQLGNSMEGLVQGITFFPQQNVLTSRLKSYSYLCSWGLNDYFLGKKIRRVKNTPVIALFWQLE